jgi:hypothetical protein
MLLDLTQRKFSHTDRPIKLYGSPRIPPLHTTDGVRKIKTLKPLKHCNLAGGGFRKITTLKPLKHCNLAGRGFRNQLRQFVTDWGRRVWTLLCATPVAANLMFGLVSRIVSEKTTHGQVALQWAMVRWFVSALPPLIQADLMEAMHARQSLNLQDVQIFHANDTLVRVARSRILRC